MKSDTSIDVVECPSDSLVHSAKKGILRSLMRPGRARKSSAHSSDDQCWSDPLSLAEGSERALRSIAIDHKLKEDSRNLRKEVEILAMGDNTGAEVLMRFLRQTASGPQPGSRLTKCGALSLAKTVKGNETSRITPKPKDMLEVESCPSDGRMQTTGMQEARIPMGPLTLHFTSIQGQQSERKKWIHAFEDVTAIIFNVDLASYCLSDQSSRNCMRASLGLFDSTVNSPWFIRPSIILFLNNLGAFKDELARTPLIDHFPDYTEGEDTDRAVEYFLRRFKQLNRAQLNLYPHISETIDQANIRLMFEDVRDTILLSAVNDMKDFSKRS